MTTPYQAIDNNSRRWVLHNGRPLGALSTSWFRGYVFPLLTPAGVNVLDECPPDHPHHQGIMVGQDLVNGLNFWAAGFRGFPQNCQLEFACTVDCSASGVVFDAQFLWRTSSYQTVLREQRVIRFAVMEDITMVDVTTTWFADYGDLYFGTTKEGGLGMRVSWPLLPAMGGVIRASNGGTGEAEVFDHKADWLEVRGQAGGREASAIMMPHPSQPSIPWFSRNYGLHLYSPRRHEPLRLPAGASTTMRVGFAAADVEPGQSKAPRAWELYKEMT